MDLKFWIEVKFPESVHLDGLTWNVARDTQEEALRVFNRLALTKGCKIKSGYGNRVGYDYTYRPIYPKTVLDSLHDALLDLNKLDSLGICFSVGSNYGVEGMVIMMVLESIMKDWPQHSGNLRFPVKGLILPPQIAFSSAIKRGTMWKGVYGKRREALLAYLIKETKVLPYAYRPEYKPSSSAEGNQGR